MALCDGPRRWGEMLGSWELGPGLTDICDLGRLAIAQWCDVRMLWMAYSAFCVHEARAHAQERRAQRQARIWGASACRVPALGKLGQVRRAQIEDRGSAVSDVSHLAHLTFHTLHAHTSALRSCSCRSYHAVCAHAALYRSRTMTIVVALGRDRSVRLQHWTQ